MVTPAATTEAPADPSVLLEILSSPTVVAEKPESTPPATPVPPAISTPSAETLLPRSDVPSPSQASEIAYLRRQSAQYEAEKAAQATEATLQQEARAVQQEALSRGFTAEDALWVAQRHYTTARRVSQETQQLRVQQQNLQDKQNAAIIIGRQYSVDPTVLMTGDSPEAMTAIAEREKRYAAQETRLKALEQRQVPSQTLNASNGSQAGGITITADNIDALWMDYELKHPGMVNPYDASYRKIVLGG